ncbi:FAD-dependent monooxygenase [Mycolicibacterium sp. S2-37]|uniref:FAD-dependent monooxygenase n=1 Tax=Mycolicibacterium sp. S2-37 TaxID=2810297 RepID=UPI001A9432B7|nr:FAD-dependent monooxygenase [Mycolicibacterium sp. S2-37]MBO0680287.1 FAD-dependent monooxygenase [Mycolicibacterium sp. S2-37]
MPDVDVLVVGAGPTGLTLACALAHRGVCAGVVDRQAEGANESRAAVVNARSLEVLEPLGVAEPLMRTGIQAPRFSIRDGARRLIEVDFSALPTAYPFSLMTPQATTEAVLSRRLTELGGRVLRPKALAGLRQGDDGVTAEFTDGDVMRARFTVGADGIHSTVRARTGIGFRGGHYDENFALADVLLSGDAPAEEVILFWAAAGLTVVAPLPGGVHRIVAPVPEAPEQPSPSFIQHLLDERGSGAGRMRVGEVVWGSRFRVQHRVADTFRAGRVLLAGDAAHVHSPAGGQGMNLGIQDAVALGDALSAALDGSDAALGEYSSVRRPIAEGVVAMTDRLTRLATLPRAARPLRNTGIRAASRLPAVRRNLAWRLSGLVYR